MVSRNDGHRDARAARVLLGPCDLSVSLCCQYRIGTPGKDPSGTAVHWFYGSDGLKAICILELNLEHNFWSLFLVEGELCTRRGSQPCLWALIKGIEELHQSGGLLSSLHTDRSSEASLPVPSPASPRWPAAVPSWWLPERGPRDWPSLVLSGGLREQESEPAGQLVFATDGRVLSAWVSVCDSE